MSRVYRSSQLEKRKPLCPGSSGEDFMEEVVYGFITESYAELFQRKHSSSPILKLLGHFFE